MRVDTGCVGGGLPGLSVVGAKADDVGDGARYASKATVSPSCISGVTGSPPAKYNFDEWGSGAFPGGYGAPVDP